MNAPDEERQKTRRPLFADDCSPPTDGALLCADESIVMNEDQYKLFLKKQTYKKESKIWVL